MLSKGSVFTRTSPTTSCTQPSANYSTSLPTQPPKFSNVTTASYLTLLKSPVLHPFLPPTASTTSSCWYLKKVHGADLNSTSTITSPTHFTKKSTPMLLTTSTSFPACFLHKHPTLSLAYVVATHTIASSTGNLTLASNANYISLYTQHLNHQLVHVGTWLIFLVITSSNASGYAKLEFTILFKTVLHMLLPPLSSLLDLSPQRLQYKRNPPFTSHLTLTLVPLIYLLTHIQPHHLSHPTAAPPVLSVWMSPLAPYLPNLCSILLLPMFYKS